MRSTIDWIDLLLQHSQRHGGLWNMQILVSVGVVTFSLSKDPSGIERLFIIIGFLMFAFYSLNAIINNQDRRLSVWCMIAKEASLNEEPSNNAEPSNKNSILGKLRKFISPFLDYFKNFISRFNLSDKQASDYKKDTSEELKKKYIRKLRPTHKIFVVLFHLFVDLVVVCIIGLPKITIFEKLLAFPQ